MKTKAIMLAAEHARLYGICDETAYRNRLIKLEFEQLKIDCPGEIVETLIQRLAGKKWNGIFLSFETIREICYPKGEQKKSIELAIQLATDEVENNNANSQIAIGVKKKRRTSARPRRNN